LYILKGIFSRVIVVLGVSLLVFVLTRVVPSDPVAYMLGPRATPASIEQVKKELKLDLPIPIQYIQYIKRILFEKKLGMSLIERKDVFDIVKERLPATIELVIFAMSIAIVLGIPLGVLSATHKNTFIDQFSRVFTVSGVSIPAFWSGIMLQLLLGYGLSLLPLVGRIDGIPPHHITGLYLFDSLITLNFSAFFDSLRHIILPALVLSFSPLANFTRMLRVNMLDELTKNYIVVYRCSGISENVIVWKYMLKNAFSSTLTMIGLLTGFMLGGAFVVEKVFAWPGLARFGTDAIFNNDYNGMVGVVIIFSSAFVIINFVIDILYSYLDPRIRLRGVE